jgi:acetyl-CoA C-acetyltransferase
VHATHFRRLRGWGTARLASLKGVLDKNTTITAGNSSQLSDGTAAVVMMESKVAEKRGLSPLGIYRGLVVVGGDPGKMGIDPVFAAHELLKRPCQLIHRDSPKRHP